MQTELTNLVPSSQTKAFRRDYFVHLATVLVVLLFITMVVQCVLLLPSYLYEHGQVVAHQQELARLTANTASAQEQEARTTESNLQSETSYLLTTGSMPIASALLRAVLAVPRAGITIGSFTYTPGTSSADRSLQISGTADTREDLRSFDSALGVLPFVTSADLPISVYAKENAIPFTITLSGSLAPKTEPASAPAS